MADNTWLKTFDSGWPPKPRVLSNEEILKERKERLLNKNSTILGGISELLTRIKFQEDFFIFEIFDYLPYSEPIGGKRILRDKLLKTSLVPGDTNSLSILPKNL